MNEMASLWSGAVPPPRVVDPVGWAEANVMLPGSARSDRFDASITPWTRPLIAALGDGGLRRLTFVKPIQAGGSVVGEVALCYWLANKSGGDIQFNWQNDDQADSRWSKRIDRILRACAPVMGRWAGEPDKTKAMKGLWIMPHCNLTCQGVLTARRVASDSVKFQINEEVHDEEGWLPGRLEQAFGRLTAYWDGVSLVISNAGRKGSELHKVFEAGTQQHWEVKCPGCGHFHALKTRWDEAKPEEGGLRYDAAGCRREDGTYDYNKLEGTIRYQMPCGHDVRDDVAIRREMSLSGRYSEPRNTGAQASTRSYTLEAVSVDYIPWLSLIKQKHDALRSLKYGDPEPWHKYLRERECQFADDTDRPITGIVVLSEHKKDRAGLPGAVVRFGVLDRQKGSIDKGELPHWWGLIRDFDANGNSLLVYEGKLLTDEDAAGVMREHNVKPTCVYADSGWDSMHVYLFCLRHGFSALKGESNLFFRHSDGGRRIYSEAKPLYLMVNSPPTRANPAEEPEFLFYSKSGIRDRLNWVRNSKEIQWLVPSDVSKDYLSHMESERLEIQEGPRGERIQVWKQIQDRNDLFVLECYCMMLAEMAGLVGSREETNDSKRRTTEH